MALPGQWEGEEPVPPDEIPQEWEDPVPLGTGSGGDNENCEFSARGRGMLRSVGIDSIGVLRAVYLLTVSYCHGPFP